MTSRRTAAGGTMLSDGQVLALVALERGPLPWTSGATGMGYVNVLAARALERHGMTSIDETLLGQRVTLTDVGRLALVEAAAAERERAFRARQSPRWTQKASPGHRGMRPLGALCIHCEYRPGRPSKRYPHLATNYCSDACENNHLAAAGRDERRELANAIRELCGLPTRQGADFQAPELRAMHRRLLRALPKGGLVRHVPSNSRQAAS